jgi:hypothetical protein
VARRALMARDPSMSDIRLLMRFCGRVLRKAALILALPAVATLAYVACLWKVGELLPASRIAAMSLMPQRILWLTGYYDTARLDKLNVAKIVAPQIVVIGTSRAMQFRADFFDKLAPAAFYNMGGCCPNVREAKRAVDALIVRGSTKPRLIILGAEPSWFQSRNPNPATRRAMLGAWGLPLAATWTAVQDELAAITDRVQVLQLAWRDSRFQAAAKRRFATARDPLLDATLVGVSARATRNGFRNDGSFRYTELIEGDGALSADSVDASRQTASFDSSAIADIEQRGGPRGRFLVDDDVRTFQAILDETRAAGVQLIVVVAPIAPVANEYLRRFEETRDFMHDFEAALAGLCARYAVPFVNAYDGQAIGATDADFYDWQHPSERLIARLMLRTYADSAAAEILRPFGDGTRLAAAVAASRNRWQIYDF